MFSPYRPIRHLFWEPKLARKSRPRTNFFGCPAQLFPLKTHLRKHHPLPGHLPCVALLLVTPRKGELLVLTVEALLQKKLFGGTPSTAEV